jgi:hypothetical protein
MNMFKLKSGGTCTSMSVVFLIGLTTWQASGEDALSRRDRVEPKADEILKKMSDCLAGARAFRFESHDMIDDVLDSGQKIQFSNTRRVTVQRPNRIAGESSGDLDNERVWYKDKTLTILEKKDKVYGVMQVPDTIDAMLDDVIARFGITIPLADLYIQDPYKSIRGNIRIGRYIGLHHVGGTKCHHLAFRQDVLDWQVWIDAGEKPLPRKLVITYRETPGQPQYIAFLDKWDLSPQIDDSMFDFKPTPDLKEIDVEPIIQAVQMRRSGGASSSAGKEVKPKTGGAQ